MDNLILGDCRDVLPTLAESLVDSVVTDPPYGLEFMGEEWDKLGAGIEVADEKTDKSHPFRDGANRVNYGANAKSMQEWHQQWASVALHVLKPGGYMLAFGGTRTYHRLACAVEDAGFELRDCIMWLYGSGFPKGDGCLKPAYEPILVCRKPGKVLPLGIDECRVGTEEYLVRPAIDRQNNQVLGKGLGVGKQEEPAGRWPANILHDGSEEVLEAFAEFGVKKGPGEYTKSLNQPSRSRESMFGAAGHISIRDNRFAGDTGTAARFFYCAKASRKERGEGNKHPTVKPIALMEWLIKLVTPPNGLVLDPFLGSGSTKLAADKCGRQFIGVELKGEYLAIALNRIKSQNREVQLTLFDL
jgi:DNA modification methylase